MSEIVNFRCPFCQARIRAPKQLLGKERKCPRCGENFVVRRQPPKDADALTLPDSRYFLPSYEPK